MCHLDTRINTQASLILSEAQNLNIISTFISIIMEEIIYAKEKKIIF